MTFRRSVFGKFVREKSASDDKIVVLIQLSGYWKSSTWGLGAERTMTRRQRAQQRQHCRLLPGQEKTIAPSGDRDETLLENEAEHRISVKFYHFFQLPTLYWTRKYYFVTYQRVVISQCIKERKTSATVKGYLCPLGLSIIELIYVTEQDRSTLHSSFSLLINHFPSLPSFLSLLNQSPPIWPLLSAIVCLCTHKCNVS